MASSGETDVPKDDADNNQEESAMDPIVSGPLQCMVGSIAGKRGMESDLRLGLGRFCLSSRVGSSYQIFFSRLYSSSP